MPARIGPGVIALCLPPACLISALVRRSFRTEAAFLPAYSTCSLSRSCFASSTAYTLSAGIYMLPSRLKMHGVYWRSWYENSLDDAAVDSDASGAGLTSHL